MCPNAEDENEIIDCDGYDIIPDYAKGKIILRISGMSVDILLTPLLANLLGDMLKQKVSEIEAHNANREDVL